VPLVTHTYPAPVATRRDVGDTDMTATVSLDFGSILQTALCGRCVVTQTAPSPAAILVGALETGMRVATMPLRGSIRATVLRLYSATQTLPYPIAMLAPAYVGDSFDDSTVGRIEADGYPRRRVPGPD
jgi:hypothetical protein